MMYSKRRSIDSEGWLKMVIKGRAFFFAALVGDFSLENVVE